LLRSEVIVGSSTVVCLVFVHTTANEMNFEIPSEMKAVPAQSCSTGKSIKVMYVET